jgi:Arc/MetJ-type ribon-helix-helix transcriptional regulator
MLVDAEREHLVDATEPETSRTTSHAHRRYPGSLAIQADPTYITNMKPIQVSFDEELLRELDATEEVRRDGRSAVLRRAVEEYLERRRRIEIRERYRQAYGDGEGLGVEFEGWEKQGTWPDE